jgi:hypothetical protein
MTFTLYGSGLTPSLDTRRPRNLTSGLFNSHFWGVEVNLVLFEDVKYDVETHQPNAVPGSRGGPNRAVILVGRLVNYSTEGQQFDPEGVRYVSSHPPPLGR